MMKFDVLVILLLLLLCFSILTAEVTKEIFIKLKILIT